jgi:hypothetical protein
VSPPPGQVVTLPSSGAAAGTHLNVLPPSSDRQIQLAFDPPESGELM